MANEIVEDIRENIRRVYGVTSFPAQLRALADEYEGHDSAPSGVAMMREAADKLDAVEQLARELSAPPHAYIVARQGAVGEAFLATLAG